MVRTAYRFLFQNYSLYLKILMPVLPFLLCVLALQIAAQHYFAPGSIKFDLSLGILYIMSVPLNALIAIPWHRAYLRSPTDDIYVSINNLTKHEYAFIYFATAIASLRLLLQTMASGLVEGIVIVVAQFFAIRLIFFFPAKAVDSDITLKEAYHLSKGYYWKFLRKSFLALLPAIIIIFSTMAALSHLTRMAEMTEGEQPIYLSLFLAPIFSVVLAVLFISPIMVTIVSALYAEAIYLETND